jgi:hypothetical protein
VSPAAMRSAATPSWGLHTRAEAVRLLADDYRATS